ncbi:hypothetical protein HII17_16280 [Thalassotalea sp. M1531]|uniref:PKD/Chitinase domain-containing protein n=1 Tax=Thalassotalea algicola TaxID=2716224 RepID=A0A7Y0LFC2_9GAMM|nr:hypothetical protein [Thalassotalea algicola]NMP33117.1 hypothetical protein [Thalassotalea algicola]
MATLLKQVCCAALVFTLSACGGGGGSSKPDPQVTPPANKTPTIGLSNSIIDTGATIVLAANASDSDGTIASYEWQQKSGPEITISDPAASTITFIAPDVEVEQKIVITLTVIDDDGAGISKDIELTITPKISTFTISGKVVTETTSLSAAPVDIIVGEHTFSGLTNELGVYSIEVSGLKAADEQTLVRIEARGASTNSIIKMVSYVDIVGNLRDAATENGLNVTQENFPQLTVSTASSAAALLMDRANENSPITTLQTLENSANSFSTDIYISHLAIYESILNNIGNVDALPDSVKAPSFNNLYDFLLMESNTTALIQELTIDTGARDDLAENIANNPDSNLKNISLFQGNDNVISFYTPEGFFQLASNNTGTFANANGEQSISWSRGETSISITLSNSIEQPIKQVEADYLGYVDAIPSIYGYNLSWLFDSPNRDIIIIEPVFSYTNPDDNSPISVIDNTTSNVSNGYQLTTALSELFSNGEAFSLKFTHPNQPTFDSGLGGVLAANIATFNLSFSNNVLANMTSYEISENNEIVPVINELTWHVTDDILTIENEQWQIEIVIFDDLSDFEASIFVTATLRQNNEDFHATSFGQIFKPDSQIKTLTTENVVGFYQYQDDSTELNPLYAYWYELREDGTLSYIQSGFDTADADISSDDIWESPGFWRIEDNVIKIKRYRANRRIPGADFNCTPTQWTTTFDDSCLVYMERDWHLLAERQSGSQNKNLVEQHIVYYQDPYISEEDISALTQQHAYNVISTIYSNFIKRDTRPVTLPADYVLIKDR